MISRFVFAAAMMAAVATTPSCGSHKSVETMAVKTQLDARSAAETQAAVRLSAKDSHMRVIERPHITIATDSSLTTVTADRITVATDDSMTLRAVSRASASDTVATRSESSGERTYKRTLGPAGQRLALIISLMLNFALLAPRLLSSRGRSARR